MLRVNPNARGTFSPGRRTKFEVQQAAFGSDIGVEERQQMLADTIGRVFRKVNQTVTQYWGLPPLVRVIGADAAQYFVQLKPEDLQSNKAEILTSVDVDSMRPRNREADKEEMLQMIQVLASLPNANIFPLIRQLLSKFPWADVQGILPMGNGGQPVGFDQFVQGQAQLQGQPQGQLGQQAQANIQPLVQAAGGRQ